MDHVEFYNNQHSTFPSRIHPSNAKIKLCEPVGAWIFTADEKMISSIFKSGSLAVDTIMSIAAGPRSLRFTFQGRELSWAQFRRGPFNMQWQLLSSPYNRIVHRQQCDAWLAHTSTLYRSQKTYDDINRSVGKRQRGTVTHRWEHVIPLSQMIQRCLHKKQQGSLTRNDALRVLFCPVALITQEEDGSVNSASRDKNHCPEFPFRRYKTHVDQIILTSKGVAVDLHNFRLGDHYNVVKSIPIYKSIWEAIEAQ